MRCANGTAAAVFVILSVFGSGCDPKPEPPTGPTEARLVVNMTATLGPPIHRHSFTIETRRVSR